MSSKSPANRIDDGRPTVQELRGEHPMAEAAKRWWLRERPAKFNPDKLKAEIYDVLEGEAFGKKSLLVLENLQFLEKYLWPNFSESASDFHVVLIALMVNVKRREEAPVWEYISTSPENFTILFRRILEMAQDTTIDLIIRSHLLTFIVSAFQSLDSALVRKEVAPLVNIGIWNNISSAELRNEQFEKYPPTKKMWRANVKRFESLDEEGQIRATFERTWLTKMIANFFNLLWQPTPEDTKAETVSVYCERFIELLCDLESQLPTRRYLNLLLKDLNVLTAIQLSPLVSKTEDTLLRDLLRLLDHFVYFAIDDLSGKQLSADQVRSAHNSVLAKLQRVSFKHFKEKLTLLALANFGVLGTREELISHFVELDDEELIELCKNLGLRTAYPKGINLPITREYLTEVLLCVYERRVPFQDEMRSIPVLPNERSLDDAAALSERPYDGSRPLALPKLNLQYLTVGDFLWRSFILYRHEAYFGIRRNIEDTLKRLNPKIKYPSMETSFHGTAKMALTVACPSIMEVLPPKVGEDFPASVRVEVSLDLSRASNDVREGWESLRQDDIVFLLAVKGADEGDRNRTDELSLTEKYGIKALRSASVAQVLDRENRPLRFGENQAPRYSHGFIKLHLFLDPEMYQADTASVKDGKPDIYESMNLVIRRKPRENNFKPILESIKSLATSNAPLPSWLSEVFLGFGDPTSATNLSNRRKTIDFRDTFLDWQHLAESFPEKTLVPVNGATEGCQPPYVLTELSAPAEEAPKKGSKKRRRDQMDIDSVASNSLEVSTYSPANMGPYPTDIPRRNTLRFTPSQAAAIASGTNTGLTIVVGPPGTGKTDVATQVISNVYHLDKSERILLVAHSNQALNQLFEKITKLDIDERHLLRLGHGEEGVTFSNNATAGGWGKKGRVESFMQNRASYLAEVDRLAASLGAPGAHGDSCETAGYFEQVYVQPAWGIFEEKLNALSEPTAKNIYDIYPFNGYFSNAPKPMFDQTMSGEEALEAAKGGYRHIRKIFEELSDLLPFELLKNQRDRQNYLLVKEARIIAMTSTHAAIKRKEIAKLSFTYTTLILEEAAQITELETFIPLCLSSPTTNLNRLLLLGDHLQNSPILQHNSLKSFTNLSQSLFLRLIRVGAPIITLHHQARSRPEIANLFSWRYDDLRTLPAILAKPEFKTANAGFAHTVQFINVPDYKGAGETQPGENYSVQNLGEAEYAVAIYQYMRLLGYPKERITILTPYAGQRGLIRDVLQRRCMARGVEHIFGMPKGVATVDKFQGEQNDYVILSLTRTNRIGYLRDIRRMTVALSRARLGLYVLGRREVFESCFELQDAWKRLLPQGRGEKLELVTGEVWGGCERIADECEGVEKVVMEGVEHLGSYVWEMTKTKLESLKARKGVKAVEESGAMEVVDEEDGEEEAAEAAEAQEAAAVEEVEMVDV